MHDTIPDLAPGHRLARGVCRYLRSRDFACVEEFRLPTGRRVDVIALGPGGQIWVVECKSSRADFTSDAKWQGYLEWCDRYFWAVDTDFPVDLLPDDTGMIIADAWDGDIVRDAPETRLAGARRKALTLRIARTAAMRVQAAIDPAVTSV